MSRASTSWGGGRARRASRLLALTLGVATLAAPLPALAASAPTTRVVVIGRSAGAALAAVGGTGIRTLTPGVAVGLASADADARLTAEGYRVAPDAPVSLAVANDQGSQSDQSDQGAQSAQSDQSAQRGRAVLSVRNELYAQRVGDGAGQTIAVLDSGVDAVPALAGRVIDGADFTGTGFADSYGHGTFVAGLIAGNGLDSFGHQTGIEGVAPAARIVSVKIADAQGRSTVGQVVAGLAWVIAHASTYQIGVVNLSLSVSQADSYETDPIDAVAEAAWFSGLVVVASAGNDGGRVLRAPGNDPFVLTVGSVADNGSLRLSDHTLSPYSDSGLTQDGVAKPEVTALGEHVQAPLPDGSTLAGEQTVDGLPAGYGQLSGTSMSAAVASGAAALLLADHPGWRPGLVKAAFEQTRSDQLGEIQLPGADNATPTRDANAAYHASVALAVAYAQQVLHTRAYRNVIWSDVTWSDVTWSDVTWSDVSFANVVSATVTWSDVTWSDSVSGSSGATQTGTTSQVTWSDVTWSNALDVPKND
ncbi:MAG TPA: S8 family serine peptidase [Mycobacteriales bacterium]|nr:S8 family serine peptidase [Mycobacteriales bacterium]